MRDTDIEQLFNGRNSKLSYFTTSIRGNDHVLKGDLALHQSVKHALGSSERCEIEAQWDDYIRALDYRFTSEDEALIDRLVVTGHPSTPGFNDPAYPIEGRKPRTMDVRS